MELEYKETRWVCPKCDQPVPRDAYPKCSACGHFEPRSDSGRMMEATHRPKPWELTYRAYMEGRRAERGER